MFDKTTFINGSNPPINATNLNNLGNGIYKATKQTGCYGTTSTGNDTYVVTFTPALDSYDAGMTVKCKVDVANTGTATININSLGAKTIKKLTNTGLVDLETGDLYAGQIIELYYDGTYFQLINPIQKLYSLITAGNGRKALAMNSSSNGYEFIDTLQSLLTASGDIVYASAANTIARLGKGTDGQVLGLTSGLPSWITTTKTTTGSYTGNNATNRTISLDFTPKVVFVYCDRPNLFVTFDSTYGFRFVSGGIGIQSTNANRPALTTNGFIVSGSAADTTNYNSVVFYYLAIS